MDGPSVEVLYGLWANLAASGAVFAIAAATAAVEIQAPWWHVAEDRIPQASASTAATCPANVKRVMAEGEN